MPSGSTPPFNGATLERFSRSRSPALKTFKPDPAEVAGHALVFVGRRGKHLLLDFGTATFVIHLMQGGRLKPEPEGKPPAKPRGGIARWTVRRRARPCCSPRPAPSARPACGSSPVTRGASRRSTSWARRPTCSTPGPCSELLAAHPMRLHGFLRDQRLIAGAGAAAWPTRSATGPSCRRSPRRPSCRPTTPPGWSRPSEVLHR